MKKRKIVGMLCLVTGLSVVLFNGCDKHIRMNTDKCAEIALEYLESKYQTEFEVLDSSEPMRIGGPRGYAEVTVRRKSEDNENKYMVIVYPDGSTDADKDGYYDSYKVVADDYMCELIVRPAKSEVDNLLINAGLTRFLSRISIGEVLEGVGIQCCSADFPIIEKNDFSLEQLLDNYHIDISCYLEISENELSDTLQNDIKEKFKTLVSDDFISFYIVVHSEENFNERELLYKENELLYKNDRTNKIKGIKSISIFIKEEDEDESK